VFLPNFCQFSCCKILVKFIFHLDFRHLGLCGQFRPLFSWILSAYYIFSCKISADSVKAIKWKFLHFEPNFISVYSSNLMDAIWFSMNFFNARQIPFQIFEKKLLLFGQNALTFSLEGYYLRGFRWNSAELCIARIFLCDSPVVFCEFYHLFGWNFISFYLISSWNILVWFLRTT
jgi:hypothetical protein